MREQNAVLCPRILSLSFLAAALVVLAGCSILQTRREKQARQDLKAAESVYRPESARPALPPLTETSSLADLVQYAVLNNPKVEQAFYDWKAAVEEVTTARSLPDPMLNLSGEIMGSLVGLTPELMTDPMMNWPGPGKLSLRAQAAYGEVLKKRAVFESELLATALNVKRIYYQIWLLEEQIRWTSEALAVVDEMEGVARERLAVGSVTQQDVLRAQMERDRLKNQVVNAEDSRTPLHARLRSALGMRPGEVLPALKASFEPNAPDFTEESLFEIAFARNPRLKEMRGEVFQAVALFRLARRSSVPDFSLGLGANVKESPVGWMPSFGVTLPIWRDKVAAEIARGGAGVKAARARLSAEELELAVRFAETAFAWREADRNVKLYDERLLPKAKASLDSARAGYIGGISGFLDLLEGERTLLDYSLNRSTAIAQREMIFAEMTLVILGRWPEGVVSVLVGEPSADLKPEKPPTSEGRM
jgi:outer membrane protein TolC